MATRTTVRTATELFERYERGTRFDHNPEPTCTRFRILVDQLVQYMMDGKIAPDEMRDAAFVASVQFAALRPVKRMVYNRDDLTND